METKIPQPKFANQAKPKKSKKGLVFILIILFLGVGVFAVSRFVNPLFLASSVFNKIASKLGGTSAYTLTASSGTSTVELVVLDKKMVLTLTAVDKSLWPKSVLGGLYQIEPSGEFSQPVKMKITFEQDPGPFFSLGYWQAETKKWEWIPTVKREPGVYEAVLLHASEVGGAQNPNYQPRFHDPGNQAIADQIMAELMKVQQEMANNQDQSESWKKVWDKTKELTDKLIKDFCDKLSGKSGVEFTKTGQNTINDLLAGWELTQYLNFVSLQPGYEAALAAAYNPKLGPFDKRECKEEEKEEEAAYHINQTDNYNNQINLSFMQGMYSGNQTSQTIVFSTGNPTAELAKDSAGWKTAWRVLQRSEGYSTGNQRLYKEYSSPDSYALIDIAGNNLAAKSTDLNSLTFDLTGINQGDTFPITVKRVGAYISRNVEGTPPLKGILITKDSDGHTFKWTGSKKADLSAEIAPGATREMTGVLLKDNGDDGGVIGFQAQPYMTPEQLLQFKEATKNAPPELKALYDSMGNPTFVSGDLEAKPLTIKKGKLGETNPADDYKGPDQGTNQNKPNPNDLDGDGLPDPVPLTPNDLDGDGLPDPVPLTNPNDLNGDGIPDLVPLVP